MDATNAWGFSAVLVQSIAALGWPCALVGSIWILREDIKKLLPSLRLSHNGTEIAFVKQVEKIIEDVQANEAEQLSKPPPAQATMNLSELSDNDLRLAVEGCTSKMRAMERSFTRKREDEHTFALDDKDRWRQLTHAIIEQSNQQRHKWQSELLPNAIALRDELLKRLNRNDEATYESGKVAFEGMLAGPSPLHDAALYLERLARDLPGAR